MCNKTINTLPDTSHYYWKSYTLIQCNYNNMLAVCSYIVLDVFCVLKLVWFVLLLVLCLCGGGYVMILNYRCACTLLRIDARTYSMIGSIVTAVTSSLCLYKHLFLLINLILSVFKKYYRNTSAISRQFGALMPV